jgi:hypothetical protein
MKTSLDKKFSFSLLVIAMAVATVGCAEKKNPMEGYKKGVLPYTPQNAPAREQKRDECGFAFTTPGVFEVAEGGTFKQEVSVVGMKTFDGALALQGEPKGMSISTSGSKSTVTYVVPRGIVPPGSPKIPFEFSVLPAEQVGRNIQCVSKFQGTVAVTNLPQVTISGAPTEINLDSAAAKYNFSVTAKALGLKSTESLKIEISYDGTLYSSERPILNLAEALQPAKDSLAVSPNERMFAIELDSAKLASQVTKSNNAKLKKMPEIYAIAVITAKNAEDKNDKNRYSKNLVIKVTRTLPVAATKAAPAKAGK